MNKICTKCKKNKALEDYYKDTSHKDSKTSECKSCRNIRQKRYDESDRGRLTKAKANAKYSKSNKGKLANIRGQAKYDKSDKGKLRRVRYKKSDKGKLTHIKHMKSDKGRLTKAKANAKYSKSDKGKAANVRYKKTDKGKASKARVAHNRRTNISNSTNTLTDKEFNCILFLQNYQCIGPDHEGSRFFDIMDPQKDHIYPVSKGGNFTKDTVQALCRSCDSKKGIQYIDYRSNIHKETIATLV